MWTAAEKARQERAAKDQDKAELKRRLENVQWYCDQTRLDVNQNSHRHWKQTKAEIISQLAGIE